MNDASSALRARHLEVRGRVAQAAARSGRPADAAILVAVVKNVAIDQVKAAVALGLADLGESRVQEAERHIREMGREAARWHMIGHLQRNKAGRAAELFDCLHAVDSAELAGALSRRAVEQERRLPVLIEVNVSGEATKFGVAPEELRDLAERVVALPGLSLEGLMTVGPPVRRPEEARPGFARLRELRNRMEGWLGARFPELSMGMSDDFEVAVEEGATLVRVGTALFGARL